MRTEAIKTLGRGVKEASKFIVPGLACAAIACVGFKYGGLAHMQVHSLVDRTTGAACSPDFTTPYSPPPSWCEMQTDTVSLEGLIHVSSALFGIPATVLLLKAGAILRNTVRIAAR